jgi:hypothetical protein
MQNTPRYRITIFGSSTCTSVPKVLTDLVHGRESFRSGEWRDFVGEGNGLRYDAFQFAQELQLQLFKCHSSFSLKLEVRQEDDRAGKMLVFTAPAKTTLIAFAIGYAGIVDITNFEK